MDAGRVVVDAATDAVADAPADTTDAASEAATDAAETPADADIVRDAPPPFAALAPPPFPALPPISLDDEAADPGSGSPTLRTRVDAERDRLLGHRARLAAQRTALQRAEADDARAQQARSSRTLETQEAFARAIDGSPTALQHFERLTALLDLEHRALRTSLDTLRQLPAPERFAVNPAVQGLTGPGNDRATLDALVADLDALGRQVDAQRRDILQRRIQQLRRRAQQLHLARLSGLSRLPEADADALTGLGRPGLAEVRREIEHLRLGIASALSLRAEHLLDLGQELRDPFALSALVLHFVLASLAITAVLVARRRLAAWAGRGESAALRPPSDPGARVWRALRGAVSVWQEAVSALALLVLPEPLGLAPTGQPAMALLEVLRIVAVWRLAVALAAWWLGLGRASAHSPAARRRRYKVARTLRVTGRYVLGIALGRALARAALGPGALYGLVVPVGWMAATPLCFGLLGWWREEVAEAWRARHPTGRIVNLLDRTSGQWRAALPILAAALTLGAEAALAAGQRFVMGFVQARRTLAFLTRLRLERTAPRAVEDDQPLPASLAAAFAESGAADASFTIVRTPSPTLLPEALDAWLGGRGPGEFVLVSPTGHGKTAWMDAAVAQVDQLAITRVSLPDRITDADALLALIAARVGLDAPITLERLTAVLRTGPRRVMVLDDLHAMVLRGVGTRGAWRMWRALVVSTDAHVFWLGSIQEPAYAYLRWIDRDPAPFAAVAQLRAWSEDELEALIRARLASGGWEPAGVVRTVGANLAPSDRLDLSDLVRMVWDYTEGCPRVALRYTLRSLVPQANGRVAFRLFPSPDETRLDALTEPQRTTLAAVVWHDSLTRTEAVTALGYEPTECAAMLDRLHGEGVLCTDPSADGGPERYRVDVLWWPGVMRHLRRRNLLHSV